MHAPAPTNNAFAALLSGARAKRKQGDDAAGGAAGGGKARRSEGSSLAQCPVCGRSIHVALLESHAATCAAAGDDKAAAPAVQHAALDSMQAKPDTGAARVPPSNAAGNAFAVMLASAAELKSRADGGVFACDLVDGSFQLSWLSSSADAATQQAAAWRETVDVRDKSLPSGSVKVVLTSNLAPGPGPLPWPVHPPEPGEGKSHMTPSQLKSAVQKNVRLGRPGPAVRCAAQLLALDASDGIRRLCVIAIEDAILPPEHMPLLTWLMAAQSKGYALRSEHAAAVLQCVHDLAAVAVRDSCSDGDAADGTQPPGTTSDTASLAAPPVPWAQMGDPHAAMLVKCLLMRAAFGGMTGDVHMLHAAASCWARRFAGISGAPTPLTGWGEPAANTVPWLAYLRHVFAGLPPAEHVTASLAGGGGPLSAVAPLRLRDVPATTFDMHCSNIVADIMKDRGLSSEAQSALEKLDELDKGLSSLIWHMRSKTNTKRPICEPDAGDEAVTEAALRAWDLVQPLVVNHQTRLLARAFW